MNYLQGLLVPAAVAIMLAVMLTAATRGRPTVVEEDGTLRFRYSSLFRGFAFFSGVIIPLGFIVLLSFLTWNKISLSWRGLGLLGFFCAMGMTLWREAARFAVVVSDEGLDCHSPWLSRKFIAWDQVEAVSFNTLNQWFIIKAKDGRKFRVHVFVAGISEFLEQCEQHLPYSVLLQARLGYGQVGRSFPGY